MGSLLPGWDERIPGVPPKEMEDYNDTEEREGYFVRLRKFQSLKRAGSGSPPRAARTLAHQASVTLGRPSAPNPRTLSRQASLPDDWRLDEPASPHTPLTPEASLGASLPSSLGSPGAARLDAYRTQRATKFKYSWWDKMGSSALNEKPDEEPSDDHKGYVPQFGVTGQEMHYHMEQEVEAHGDDASGVVHAAA